MTRILSFEELKLPESNLVHGEETVDAILKHPDIPAISW
jgi:hypothetical protein